MKPDRRLDQLEPLMADALQKIDRLIEGQGQILDIAIRADQKADITAKGLANLTIKVNDIADKQAEFHQEVNQRFDGVNQRFEDLNQKIDTEIGGLRQEMNQRFDQLVTLIMDRL